VKNEIDTGYPRPQLRREGWTNLNGAWRFAFDDAGAWSHPDDVRAWTHAITVPFAPETAASGIHDTGFHPNCWYQREFDAKSFDGRALLHFGAVDYHARVWVNGVYVGEHRGGHTPFHFDVTAALRGDGELDVVTVWAEDDPHDLAKPRGKQDWQLEPHSIWYPRTSGIWQTVWLERVPSTYVCALRWTPHFERWEIGFEGFVSGPSRGTLQMRVTLSCGGTVVVDDTYRVKSGEVHRRIVLSDPGIDDYRNELLWSPEKPTLIEATIELMEDGRVVDVVESYTAMRTVAVRNDHFHLNGRPYYLRLVLDQGYWPDTNMTAPSDDALRRDVELVKAMGFNGVRKHQKIEDPRFLFWADRLGLLVWEEMPSAYRFTEKSVERLTTEWMEVIARDSSHPCIVAWVPFNESWGVPDLPATASHRHYVQGLFHLTKSIDPTRPVIGNDGWENLATDIVGIHDYETHPDRLAARYGRMEKTGEVVGRFLPAGRLLALEGFAPDNHAFMLTEFGGIAFTSPQDPEGENAWGYSRTDTANELQVRYSELLGVVNRIEMFGGFCYTQLTDTFQEANGLLYADRTPKFPLAAIAEATHGRTVPTSGDVPGCTHEERLVSTRPRDPLVAAEDSRAQRDPPLM
jgi:beta-galactosidase/beta-glucuronidase